MNIRMQHNHIKNHINIKWKQTAVLLGALAAVMLLTGRTASADIAESGDGETVLSYTIADVSDLTLAAGETAVLAPSLRVSTLTAGSIDDMTAADFYNLASDQNRSQDADHVYIGIAVEDGTLDTDNSNWSDRYSAEEAITLNDYVQGEGFTAVYANNSSASITGTLVLDSDKTGGTYASDFSGVGVAVVAGSGSDVTLTDASITTDGFVRSAAIAYSGDLTITGSTLLCLGDDPLTEAYDGYYNSSDTNAMLSPPWVLGIQGGVRAVNVLGDYSSVYIKDSSITSGGWAVVSSDGCNYPAIVIADTAMKILPASDEDGMDSGWAVLGYNEADYGSGYGVYCIGGAHEYFYGTSIIGTTYAAIVRSGDVHYASSEEYTVYEAGGAGSSDAVAGETAEGSGDACTIRSVFGFLFHSSEDGSVEVADGTSVSTENAAFLFKGGSTVDITVDDSTLDSEDGVLLQMLDDDDETVGADSSTKGFNATLEEGSGLPSENGSVSESTGGEVVNITLSNGTYEGDLYNGTGYYSQGGDTLAVTIADGASLTGDISLTQTVHGIAYSESAVSAIEALDGEVAYELLTADGEVTENASQAAYIHFTSFTINQYYLLGHVLNFAYYNGTSELQVRVSDGGTWTVEEECILTCLIVEDGASVYGTLTDNEDGTYTLTPSAGTVATGTYGTEVNTQGSSGGDMSGDLDGGMPDGGDMGGDMPDGGDMGGDMPDGGGDMPDGDGDMPDGGDMGGDMPDSGDLPDGGTGGPGGDGTAPGGDASGTAAAGDTEKAVMLLSASSSSSAEAEESDESNESAESEESTGSDESAESEESTGSDESADSEESDQSAGSAESADVTFTYESADPDIADVDESGTVTGIAAGSTAITIAAYTGDTLTAETQITVTVTGDASGTDRSTGGMSVPHMTILILVLCVIAAVVILIHVYLKGKQKEDKAE